MENNNNNNNNNNTVIANVDMFQKLTIGTKVVNQDGKELACKYMSLNEGLVRKESDNTMVLNQLQLDGRVTSITLSVEEVEILKKFIKKEY
jgi:hypothetical protein